MLTSFLKTKKTWGWDEINKSLTFLRIHLKFNLFSFIFKKRFPFYFRRRRTWFDLIAFWNVEINFVIRQHLIFRCFTASPQFIWWPSHDKGNHFHSQVHKVEEEPGIWSYSDAAEEPSKLGGWLSSCSSTWISPCFCFSNSATLSSLSSTKIPHLYMHLTHKPQIKLKFIKKFNPKINKSHKKPNTPKKFLENYIFLWIYSYYTLVMLVFVIHQTFS